MKDALTKRRWRFSQCIPGKSQITKIYVSSVHSIDDVFVVLFCNAAIGFGDS